MGIYEQGNTNDVGPIALNAKFQSPWQYLCFITLDNVHSLHYYVHTQFYLWITRISYHEYKIIYMYGHKIQTIITYHNIHENM